MTPADAAPVTSIPPLRPPELVVSNSVEGGPHSFGEHVMKAPLRREGSVYAFRQELPATLARGTIVDLETTDLTPADGGVICFGALRSNRIEILARPRDVDYKRFYSSLRGIVRELPRPFYAYNASFDVKFLRKFLGFNRSELAVDLFEPWRSRAEAIHQKWPSLDELITGPWDEIPRDLREDVYRETILPLGALREDEEAWLRRGQHHRIPPRIRRVTGKQVPGLWKKYLERDDFSALGEIVDHNRQDLLKSLALLLFLE